MSEYKFLIGFISLNVFWLGYREHCLILTFITLSENLILVFLFKCSNKRKTAFLWEFVSHEYMLPYNDHSSIFQLFANEVISNPFGSFLHRAC